MRTYNPISRVYLFLLLLFTSCIKTAMLTNGHTRTAVNTRVYKNRAHFNRSLLINVDTSVIYEEYNTSFYIGDTPLHTLARFNLKNRDTYYGVYRFYGNGCFSHFTLNRNDSLNRQTFNPTYTGWRGVMYEQRHQLKGDMVTQVTGMGAIGILTETFEFKGDTLFVTAKNKWDYIYIKRTIADSLLQFNASW